MYYRKIVPQIGYLPELYEDAGSEKYKTTLYFTHFMIYICIYIYPQGILIYPLFRIISTNCCIQTVVPPNDGSRYTRNVYRLTKYTKKMLCIKLVFLYTNTTLLYFNNDDGVAILWSTLRYFSLSIYCYNCYYLYRYGKAVQIRNLTSSLWDIPNNLIVINW
jgi:hypothetical protein